MISVFISFWKLLFSGMLFAAPADWSTFWGTSGASGVLQGADLASAATIVITHPVHFVTGVTQIDLITAPWTGFKGMIVLIPTSTAAYTSGGTKAGNNIPIKVTYAGVANRPIWLYCDGNFWYVMAIA